MPSFLIACPGCTCHVKSSETRCPICGSPLRREDGGVPRTAVAVLLGLTAASAVAATACSGNVVGTGDSAGTSGAGGGATSTSISTTISTTDGSSGSVVFYGPAQTSGSTSSAATGSSSGQSSSGDAGSGQVDGG